MNIALLTPLDEGVLSDHTDGRMARTAPTFPKNFTKLLWRKRAGEPRVKPEYIPACSSPR